MRRVDTVHRVDTTYVDSNKKAAINSLQTLYTQNDFERWSHNVR